MSDIQRIPFHDDELYAIVDDRTGMEYVLPKPMADMFGLAWNGQLAKFRKNKLFAKGMQQMCIPTPGGGQDAIVLERRLVHAWLLSINVRRVAAHLQDKLLRYQEECAEVLDAYFAKGAAFNPRNADVTGPWDMLAQMVEAGRKHAEQIRELETQQRLQMATTIETQAKAIEALMASTRAEAKADIALEGVTRMRIEDFILGNKLLPKFPMADWKRIATWLGNFCDMYTLEVIPVPVVSKPWPVENSYPLPAFAAWLRYEQRRPRQIHLVEPTHEGA